MPADCLNEPEDAQSRRDIAPVICYPTETLPQPDLQRLSRALSTAERAGSYRAEPRMAATFDLPAGSFFRIRSVDGPQVGDLNLWNANDLAERFYSGKSRALHGTHLSIGDRMWSCFPYLRPMATMVFFLDFYLGWGVAL